jgi:hypothetical protein
MPGLLDFFTGGADANQTQGLLAAAAQMLQQSGPSRTPTSIGQIVGGGLNAYQGGLQNAQAFDMQRAAAGQQSQLRDLQIQEGQSDLAQRQAMLDMQQRIRARSIAAAQGQQPQPLSPQEIDPSAAQQPMASAMPGGPMSPKIGGPDWLQAYQASQPSALAAAPAVAAPPAATMSAPSAAPGNLTAQVAARLTSQAQIHAEEGDFDGANKLYEQATKFLPEVNKIEVGMSNGKPVNVITFKDGTQQVSQFAPKPDIHFADDGQHTAIPVDGYTGASIGPGITRQATPDAVLQSRQSAARLAFDRSESAAADEPGKPNETMAKQIAFYKAAPLGQFSLNKPWGQATMDRVMELNPQYDAAQYAPRAAALRAYGAGGKESGVIDSVNIGMNHVATLRDLALAQKNGQVQLFNKIASQYAAATGQAAPTNLRMAADMVAPEIVKAVSGVAGTGEERAHFAQSLTGNGTYSPDQIIGATGKVQELFAGRLSEKKRSYERSTQLDNFDSMLNPSAQQLLHPASGSAPAQQSAPAAPKTITLSDIAATARASGRSTADVTAAARAKGYTITGG